MRAASNQTERFFQVLVEEIRATSPGYLHGAFTVAEIYQSLIPYRTHRDRLGVEMNGDYEDALLRLLAGEGGHLVLESDAARARIRKELEFSNPDTGIYREFAAVGVRLESPLERSQPGLWGAGMAPEGSVAEVPDDRRAEEDGVAADERRGPERRGDERRTATRRSHDRRESAGANGASGDGTASGATTTSGAKIATAAELAAVSPFCPECGAHLPADKVVRFCPECGTNVQVAHCEECGEALDTGWKYCVSCGTPTPF